MLNFFLIEADALQQIRDNRWLRRMVDVLAEKKEPHTLQWDERPRPVYAADESWFEISALFKDDAMFGELGALVQRDAIPIKHPKIDAFFLPPERVIKTLVTFRQTAQLIGALKPRKIAISEYEYLDGKRTLSVSGEIVAQTSLRRIRLLIEARVLTKLEEPQSFLNDDRDPFSEEGALESLDTYCRFIELLTDATFSPDTRRLVHRAVVFVAT